MDIKNPPTDSLLSEGFFYEQGSRDRNVFSLYTIVYKMYTHPQNR